MAFNWVRKDAAPPVILQPYEDSHVARQHRRLGSLLAAVLTFFCIPFGFYFALFVPYLFVLFTVPLALLAALTIWALPDMRRAPTRTLTILYFAFFGALVLWPNYLAIALPGLPWITLLRLTGLPMVLLLLISISVSGEFRATLAAPLNATPVVWKALALFVCVQFLSIAFSSNTQQSIQRFVVFQTNWTAIFFVSCYVFLQENRPKRWAALTWSMAIFLGCVALAEASQQRVLWAGHIPGFLKIEDPTVQRILAGATRLTTGQYRAQSTFSTSLGLSEFMALSLPFALHFIASSQNKLVRTAAIASIPFYLIVILATDARLGILGFFIGTMGYLLFWAALLWRRKRDSLLGPAIVLAYPLFFCAIVAMSFVVGRVRNKVWGTGQYAASNEGRMDQIASGLPKVLTHPIGHGPGMGADALGYANRAGVSTIDSYFLLIGMEYGVAGFILYYGMVISCIYYAIKYAWSAHLRHPDYALLIPAAVSLTSFFAIKAVFANDDNHPLIFMIMGMVVALVYRIQQDPLARDERR